MQTNLCSRATDKGSGAALTHITNDLWEREEGPRMYGKMMRILKLSGGVSGGHRTGRPSQLADTGQAQTAQWPRSEAALQGC